MFFFREKLPFRFSETARGLLPLIDCIEYLQAKVLPREEFARSSRFPMLRQSERLQYSFSVGDITDVPYPTPRKVAVSITNSFPPHGTVLPSTLFPASKEGGER